MSIGCNYGVNRARAIALGAILGGLTVLPAASKARASGADDDRRPAEASVGIAATDTASYAVGDVHTGETIGPEHFGTSYVESMEAAVARDAVRRGAQRGEGDTEMQEVRGVWAIPSRRATFYPHSGIHYVTNKYGDTRMAIGFAGLVDVDGAFVAGQASEGVWTSALRVLGFRDGVQVAETEWFEDVDDQPDWFAMGLRRVDRIVIEAKAVINGAGWYALDDLTFTTLADDGAEGETVVLDFEDCAYRQQLSGSPYAGLTWELGAGVATGIDAVPAPRTAHVEQGEDVARGDDDGGVAGIVGKGTLPNLELDFQGVIRGDAGSNSFPPDSNGAIGPSHFVVTVNRNFGVFDRQTGAELVNIHLQSFLPNSNGDPRVLWDQFSERWIVIVSDFSSKLFLAVSMTADPMGSWFKTSFVVSTGSDSGCFPDYPTFGFDEFGIYSSSFMVGCGLTIFAIDKAPLIAPIPSLGTITAFRNLPLEGAIQPVATYGDAGGEYFVSRQSSTKLRLRRLVGPMTSPSLLELGSVTIPVHSGPPNVPALGSTTPLDHTISHRMLNAVYRNGSVWATHDIGVSGMAVCRWYEIDVDTMSLNQVGTVTSSSLHYFYGAIAVNANNDVVMAFSGANGEQYAACYYTGRLASDPTGTMAPPALLREGNGAQNNIDSFGRNRWGDYSLTTVDPDDDLSFWTIQEYAHATNIWGTWVGHMTVTPALLGFSYPNGQPDMIDPAGDSLLVAIAGQNGGELDPGSPMLFVDTGAGFVATAMSKVGDGVFEGLFPASDCGETVQYYVSAEVAGGDPSTDPPDAPVSSFDALSAVDVIVAFEEDLETPVSWTIGAAGDTATTGIWVRVNPNGTTAQPEDDHTDAPGTMCFVTGQGTPDGGLGENDVDNGQTTLTTSAIDTTGVAAATMSYWRWYSNNTGNSPNADVFTVDISNDNGATWTNVEVVGPTGSGTSGGWILHEFALADLVEPTDQVRLRFIAADLADGSIVEAAIDDVRVTSLVCAPSIPGDTDGDGDVDNADFAGFPECMTGPNGTGVPQGCEPYDLNVDGVVDMHDFKLFMLLFTGAG
ncbi:MAG: hypothetical protein IIB61_04150 [Planctomycetes bacterium]|nr:hypothetical protein [Planctomycetota bacterium]